VVLLNQSAIGGLPAAVAQANSALLRMMVAAGSGGGVGVGVGVGGAVDDDRGGSGTAEGMDGGGGDEAGSTENDGYGASPLPRKWLKSDAAAASHQQDAVVEEEEEPPTIRVFSKPFPLQVRVVVCRDTFNAFTSSACTLASFTTHLPTCACLPNETSLPIAPFPHPNPNRTLATNP